MSMNGNKEIFKAYAQIGKALSNENRLEIMSLLIQSKKTVEALAKDTNLSIANVSKHLQMLLKAKLVKNERYKNFIFYEVANETVEKMLTLFFDTAQEQIEKVNTLKEDFHEKGIEYELTLEQVEQKVQIGEILLVDVRPNDEYSNAHIPGAISIPIEELTQMIEQLPKSKQIVAYCRGPHCLMSTEAIEILEKNGREAVRLTQGVSEWKLYKKEQNI